MLFLPSLPLHAQGLLITEFLAQNQTGLVDEDGTLSDWIEIYNASTNRVSLFEWSLQAGSDQWTFPPTNLAGGSFLVVFASGKNRSLSGTNLHTSFRLSASGERLALLAPDGAVAWEYAPAYPRQSPDVAYGLPMVGSLVLTNRARFMVPTPGAPNSLTTDASKPELAITEIMFQPEVRIPGAFSSSDYEYLELKNVGTNAVDLEGCHFTTGITFDFASLALNPGQHVVLTKNRPAFGSRYGEPGLIVGPYSGSLSDGGETLRLVGPDGTVLIEVSYSGDWQPLAAGLGFSIVPRVERLFSAADNDPTAWRLSSTSGGSPGRTDPDPPGWPPVFVNEVLSRAALPYEDMIELYNPNPIEVDLSYWYLSDDILRPRKYRIPEGSWIGPNDFLAFDEHSFNAPGIKNDFTFEADGDDVYLFSADAQGELTGYVHGFRFGVSETNVTFGRYVSESGEEHFVQQREMTIFAPNAGPAIGPLVISEILVHPQPDLSGANPARDEAIEVHNISDEPVTLFVRGQPTNTWRLSENVTFSWPGSTLVPPRGFAVVVSFDPSTNNQFLTSFRSRFDIPSDVPVYGPWSGEIDNARPQLEIKRPTKPIGTNVQPSYVVVDRFKQPGSHPRFLGSDGLGLSLQRIDLKAFGDSPANWTAAAPTLGRERVPAEPPRILRSPESQTSREGGNAVFRVEATGAGPLQYQWRQGEIALPGATQSTLRLNNLSSTNEGNYSCAVFNFGGVAFSAAATLEIQPNLQISAQPSDVFARLGQPAQFSVSAVGTGTIQYQWRFQGAVVSGATEPTLLLGSSQFSQRGGYDVVVRDALSSLTSTVARLEFRLPAILTHPVGAEALPGSSVTFRVVAFDETPISYQWRFNGEDIPGATRNELTLNNLKPSSGGYYDVRLSTEVGSLVSSAAHLTFSLPQITSSPQSRVVLPGQTASLSVSASGTGKLRYQWYFQGRPLAGATNSLLVLRNVQLKDIGDYSVTVSDDVGEATASASVSLPLPRILAQPESMPTFPGATVVFRVQATGTGILRYQWLHNNVDIPGATLPTLRLASVGVEHVGEYQVRVTHDYGSILSSPASLFFPQLQFLAQPQDQEVLPGTNVVFSVSAAGTGTLRYQWLLNGSDLTGATEPTLVLTNVMPSDRGRFSVRVTDSVGSLESVSASLSMPGPQILTHPGGVTARPGTDVTLSVVASGYGSLSYQWLRRLQLDGSEEQPVPGNSGSNLTLRGLQLAQAGDYRVEVSDGFRSAISGVAEVRVLDPVITVQPLSQSVISPGTVVLSVGVEGTFPLDVAWWRNGELASFRTIRERSDFFVQEGLLAETAFYVTVSNRNFHSGTASTNVLVEIVADRDQDGLPDAWETQNGFNSANPQDAAQDRDQDGMSNLAEYMAGLDPSDPASHLKVFQIQINPDSGAAEIGFEAVSNRTYSVQTRLNLSDGEWEPMADIPASPLNQRVLVTDPSKAGAFLGSYYRVVTPAAR
jgi:hypothetical protein